MNSTRIKQTEFNITIGPTPELSTWDLQQVGMVSYSSLRCDPLQPALAVSQTGTLRQSHAAQIRNLHKQCWPAEHDEEDDDSLDGFLARATFLHDADAVTWLLLWHHIGPNRSGV